MKKKIILFGAGKRGRKIYHLLDGHNYKVEGFCDNYKTGYVMCGGGQKIPIYSIEEIENARDEYVVVIAIADTIEQIKIEKMLNKAEIEITTVEKVLYGNLDDKIASSRKLIAEYHVNEMDDYFENAESEGSIKKFWSKNSVFYEMFCELDPERMVELACGRGRHVPHYIANVKELVLVDILDKNIQYCRDRYKDDSKIRFLVNNGYNLQDLDSDSYSGVFSYDAMVHFEMMDIFSYLKEIKRILLPGGRALIHHSNNTEDYRITFSTAKYGRNYMSAQLFAFLSDRAGLKVVKQKVLDWGECKNLDCLTLLEKERYCE